MFIRAIPILHVTRSEDAERFYCEQLGFGRRFAYRPNEPDRDPCFMGLDRDGVVVHISSFIGDAVPGGAATFIVDDLDALHAEFMARGVSVDFPPTVQDWGNREMYVTDADRNSIRFVEGRGTRP
jgi:uncharacterized glyoxalase superfamily protein PhnB